jgi:predicted O-methyltransferase YrrM
MTEMADLGTAQLLQMIRGFWVSQITGTMARLEIADRLACGPMESSGLAKAIGCEPHATLRLLRAAVSVGLIVAFPNGRFGLAPAGELLRSDVPGSVRDFAIAMTAPGHWLPWGRLTEAVREGERQAVAALGYELFDYYAANPGEGSAFTGAMANHSAGVAGALAQALDTSAARHLVDIGGASGTIIAALLDANQALHGTILERADVVPRAEAALAKLGLSSRCRVVAGNFFDSVPEADLYILKIILHDWDDRQSLTILRNCARAMRPNGRVVLVERLVPEHGDAGEAALSDLNMLVLLPGRERTASEFAELFRAAGLKLDRISELASSLTLIEASSAA